MNKKLRYNSITFKILFLVIIFYVLTAIITISVVDYKLRDISNNNQQKNYSEKLNLILSRLNDYNERLAKTGAIELYIEDYQNLALSRLENNYFKNSTYNDYPMIINQKGKVLLSQNNSLSKALFDLTDNLKKTSAAKFTQKYLTLDGDRYWSIYTEFPEWQWTVAYVIPLSIKYAHATELQNNLIIIMFVCTFCSLVLLTIILSKIIKPIILLTNIADTIAKGNLEPPISFLANDEIGRLAQAFEKMRLAIKEQILQLNEEVRERKQAESNLFVTLNSIGDAVISTDNNGRIIHMNPVAMKLTGYDIKEAVGKPLLDIFNIINGDNRKQCISPVDKVLATGEIINLENHTVLIDRDGTEYHIADSGAPIRDDSDEILGVVLVFRDITEQYRLEQQLRQSDKMQAIGQLAGGIAHDFNNMLGGIIGAAEILHKHLNGTKQAEELHAIIINAADRAAELTQQLLAFSRSKKITSTAINIHEVIEDSLSLLQRTIDKSIIIMPELNAANDTIIGDPAQIQNIIINLGINASHAMSEGGTITIKTCNKYLSPEYCSTSNFELTSGDYIEISVSDTGCGISPAVQSRIFEPFFTTKSEGKGTGLGLSAVYGNVIQHHGEISMSSTINQGTTFYILFPLTEKRKNSEETLNNSNQKGHGTILIIDDESFIRTAAKAILSDAGYNIMLAENGQEGIEIFVKNKARIDLIILDMIMPVMNGKECFNNIMEIDPAAKVILASGYSKDEDIAKMKKNHLTAFIAKPYRSQELLKLVDKIINNT